MRKLKVQDCPGTVKLESGFTSVEWQTLTFQHLAPFDMMIEGFECEATSALV